MTTFCKIHKLQHDVEAKLQELGLELHDLSETLKHIGLTINSQTEDHPTWGVGITTASEAIFALRSILKPKNWIKEEEKGFALTVHPENLLAINIAKGDERTGDPLCEPKTVSEKGICTEVAITENKQLALKLPIPDEKSLIGRPTWWLIYCKKIDGIHAELSLPIGLSDNKQITSWKERIILPRITDDIGSELSGAYDDGGSEVQISRKQ